MQNNNVIQSFIKEKGLKGLMPVMYVLVLVVCGILYYLETRTSFGGAECIEIAEWCLDTWQIIFFIEAWPGALIAYLTRWNIGLPQTLLFIAAVGAGYWYAVGAFLDRSRENARKSGSI